jgi:hypothetical protein
MTLLWFVLGIALIFGIARYNESNKLFWVLLFSYLIGFAGTKMMIDVRHGETQSNVNTTEVYSTQVPTTTFSMLSCYATSVLSEDKEAVTEQKPVSQSIISVNSENVILSEVFGRTRDQPTTPFDTS